MDLKSKLLTNWLQGGGAPQMPALGHRELEALEHLWKEGSLTALGLRERVGCAEVSVNTIQSTLERLHRKGLVDRKREGRAYHYLPTLTRADIVSRTLHDLARDVAGGDLAPIISGFVGFMANDDPEIEKRLMRLLGDSEQQGD